MAFLAKNIPISQERNPVGKTTKAVPAEGWNPSFKDKVKGPYEVIYLGDKPALVKRADGKYVFVTQPGSFDEIEISPDGSVVWFYRDGVSSKMTVKTVEEVTESQIQE